MPHIDFDHFANVFATREAVNAYARKPNVERRPKPTTGNQQMKTVTCPGCGKSVSIATGA